ncbi:DUF1294 domain-containing protein [Cohnella faecalis]|uniref:DUF1294 domain-containing protein n=1 Tax=Cohnella faecalis TaxID=2315694 RepID=A0A398CH23_9BACL|nr:DUF1294 domain-containing protein [Cohnella faecalis]RIE02506.1 DUF1294 domain-containing protein [Cohnella faecalis]
MTAIIAIYLLLANIIAYSLMTYDKKLAVKGRRRIPEKTLFGWAAAGGALGALTAMRLRRHKTKHASFVVGIPLLLVLNAFCVYFLLTIIR